MKCPESRIFSNFPMALRPRELNTLVGCSKRLTADRPVKISFLERKVVLCHVPEAKDSGSDLAFAFGCARD
jgi:hypothetical protein